MGAGHFYDGMAYINVPNYDLLGDFRREDRLAWTLAIDSVVPPRVQSDDLQGIERISSDGFAGSLEVGYLRPGDTISVRIPSIWRLVERLLSETGYQPEISDKGRLCLAVWQLFAEPVGPLLLASSRFYELLRRLAEISVRQATQRAVSRFIGDTISASEAEALSSTVEADLVRESQFDRQHVTWSRLSTGLGSGVSEEEKRAIVNWTIDRRILLRGYEIRCPNCNLRRWYAVDRIGAEHLCEGCQTSMPLPVGVDNLQWRYRLNEVVAHAVDQGVLPHLLAQRKLIGNSAIRRADLLGVSPGLLLQPIEGISPPSIEVDLFALERGAPVIGECKSSDSFSSDELTRFAELGRRLEARRIVYAAPTKLRSSVLEEAREKDSTVEITIWDGTELLDPIDFPSAGASSPSESRASRYLSNLSARYLL